eukprot:CAMPEP_0202904166 /NCGR_PEP_ID=MMETSP1392-20130828/28186_1 /ASSEMBLY_ACC=CAM_ASM_000868 /TAXON_ID=225041 /ORGANISM="Chlamydomonas chlamydogama, Strain SAG 11-48b" /LENGTH=271 /DNA_ID=CAMNT_0049591675 /DNA_START=443 /DNA_END=1258 /DNA_ORIENTATION=+
MEDLMKALITPLPLGRVRNHSLEDLGVEINRTLIIDPSKTLQSVMRALYVIKQVLKDNGHIYIINSNPLSRPLVHEAALCCTNPNMWFLSSKYTPGTLANHGQPHAKGSGAPKLFSPHHQPNQVLLAARGRAMVNPYCPVLDVMDQPKPALQPIDKWRLWSKRNSPQYRDAYNTLRAVVHSETHTARLPLPRSLQGDYQKLRLIIALDLTHDQEAVQEAYERNVMTISLVNAHSDLSRITYPVYAGEFHLGFQHFFLDWIVKVANLPPQDN